MNKVITSVNALLAPEGIRVAYTYSEMDEEGEILSRRNKGYFIATDEAELEAVDTLKLAAARRLGAVADNDSLPDANSGTAGAETGGSENTGTETAAPEPAGTENTGAAPAEEKGGESL